MLPDSKIGIVLESNRYGEMLAIIDREMYPKVGPFRWVLYRGQKKHVFYAQANPRSEDGKQHHISLHRIILEPGEGVLVDHKNGDGLLCTTENLRACDTFENARNGRMRVTNKSGYRGVHYRSDSNVFRAVICVNWKHVNLGQFSDRIEAARAYDRAALLHHGQFARTNFPLTDYLPLAAEYHVYNPEP
jgi:hypothetical protein